MVKTHDWIRDFLVHLSILNGTSVDLSNDERIWMYVKCLCAATGGFERRYLFRDIPIPSLSIFVFAFSSCMVLVPLGFLFLGRDSLDVVKQWLLWDTEQSPCVGLVEVRYKSTVLFFSNVA